ncbi:efflux RND transporter periplasmic adaptor subunit [Anaeromyxobacter paludicola]|uniref:RND transporter n=1 Tax=Anaeromyxobacter paludicola TaxID=2918171 RepID=A0ABM7X6W3_9BACT|nr:efflux RND transporter periplasmic adaptor subunit [Anaeromyxobacter paludicola]BDG07572.1 RND transporter [Anaeromyxobacter paludicola]
MTPRRLLPALLLLTLASACRRAPATGYRTEPVSRGALAEVVSATGDVSAIVTVNVGSQVSGTISKLYVDFNSTVKKDQILAEIDPRLFQAALERANASLAAAQADVVSAQVALVAAERTFQRNRELLQRSLVAQADLDNAETARDAAAAQVQSSRAKVLQARADRDTAATNLALCHIRSPIDGVVISRSVDVGQTVAAAFQAPTLFLIANDLTRMQILANIDEADVGKVKEGLETRFTVDAYPGETFHGRIREVRQAPSTIQNVVTYAAVIDARNPERKLRQGMTAAVTVTTSRRADALRVPNAALRYRPAGEAGGGRGAPDASPGERRAPGAERGGARGQRPVSLASTPPAGGEAPPAGRPARVYRLQGGKPAPVDLLVGISDGHATEVVSGLAEGDQVIVGDSGGPSGQAPGGPRRGPF